MHFFNCHNTIVFEYIAKCILMIETGLRLYDENWNKIDMPSALNVYNTEYCDTEMHTDVGYIYIIGENSIHNMIASLINNITPYLEKLQDPATELYSISRLSIEYTSIEITSPFIKSDDLEFINRRLFCYNLEKKQRAAFTWIIYIGLPSASIVKKSEDWIYKQNDIIVDMNNLNESIYRYIVPENIIDILVGILDIPDYKKNPLFIINYNDTLYPATTENYIEYVKSPVVKVNNNIMTPSLFKIWKRNFINVTNLENDNKKTCQRCNTILINPYAYGIVINASQNIVIGICLKCAYTDSEVKKLIGTEPFIKYPIQLVDCGRNISQALEDIFNITIQQYNEIINIFGDIKYNSPLVYGENSILLKHNISKIDIADIIKIKKLYNANIAIAIVASF
jgi:hypothetical protein